MANNKINEDNNVPGAWFACDWCTKRTPAKTMIEEIIIIITIITITTIITTVII